MAITKKTIATNKNMVYRMLAVDLGASSGRAILGIYDGNDLTLREVRRFGNVPIHRGRHLRWDFSALKEQISLATAEVGKIDSIGFDTWGVDFGLLSGDELIEDPVHYRDQRTHGMVESVLNIIPAAELYRRTGNQIMPINTLFQLAALKKYEPDLLSRADKLLFMPDLFAHAFGGAPVCDCSIASTSQMFDPITRTWDTWLADMLSIPSSILPKVVKSGSIVGKLNGTANTAIVAVGHDTQCAVAAMPRDEGAAFLSCGTWCLIGTEIDSPILTENSMKLALSNELGTKVQFLKNIVGLWIIQECKRVWNISFPQIASEAADAQPFGSFIDPDDQCFASQCDMPQKIKEYCLATGQSAPASRGETARCVYESLALKYRHALELLSEVSGKTFTSICMLGGGANVPLLCEMTASASGIDVVVGQSEATAYGNLLIQLSALKRGDLPINSRLTKRYEPHNRAEWDKAYERFLKIIEKY